MKKNKNILIRDLTDDDNLILDDLRKSMGIKTNSSAMLGLLREYGSVKADLETLILEYKKLAAKNMELSDSLNKVREALGQKREPYARLRFVIKNGTERI